MRKPYSAESSRSQKQKRQRGVVQWRDSTGYRQVNSSPHAVKERAGEWENERQDSRNESENVCGELKRDVEYPFYMRRIVEG